MAQVGKRYAGPDGAEVIVTKGSDGVLMDGETPFIIKGGEERFTDAPLPADRPMVQLGKRYRSADGAAEVLVIKAGLCDLRYDGQPMELLQPKVLPSAD